MILLYDNLVLVDTGVEHMARQSVHRSEKRHKTLPDKDLYTRSEDILSMAQSEKVNDTALLTTL